MCSQVKHIWLTNKQKLEQKLGDALGVEMATQKAVEELSSKGLLQQGEMKSKLDGIKQEANKSVTHKE